MSDEFAAEVAERMTKRRERVEAEAIRMMAEVDAIRDGQGNFGPQTTTRSALIYILKEIAELKVK